MHATNVASFSRPDRPTSVVVGRLSESAQRAHPAAFRRIWDRCAAAVRRRHVVDGRLASASAPARGARVAAVALSSPPLPRVPSPARLRLPQAALSFVTRTRGLRAPRCRSYLLSKTIGEGTFGKVKLAVHLLTGERVAVKVLEKDRITDKGDVKRVTREIQILKHIHHPHIVNLLEVIEKPRHIYLVTEYVAGGELFEFIVTHGRLQETQACRILR